jgi:hypothetical protein
VRDEIGVGVRKTSLRGEFVAGSEGAGEPNRRIEGRGGIPGQVDPKRSPKNG